jgi:hypothetical protein
MPDVGPLIVTSNIVLTFSIVEGEGGGEGFQTQDSEFYPTPVAIQNDDPLSTWTVSLSMDGATTTQPNALFNVSSDGLIFDGMNANFTVDTPHSILGRLFKMMIFLPPLYSSCRIFQFMRGHRELVVLLMVQGGLWALV